MAHNAWVTPNFLFNNVLGLDINLPWLTPYRIKIGGKENALVLWASSLPITWHNSIRVKNLFKSLRLFRLMPHPCRNLLSNYWETRYISYSRKYQFHSTILIPLLNICYICYYFPNFRSSFKLRIGMAVAEWVLMPMDASWSEQMITDKDFVQLVIYRRCRMSFINLIDCKTNFAIHNWWNLDCEDQYMGI